MLLRSSFLSFFNKNGPFPASSSLFSSFHYTVDCKQMFDITKFLPMTGFEPRISGIRSDRSTNWATTTFHATTKFVYEMLDTFVRCWTLLIGPDKIALDDTVSFLLVHQINSSKYLLNQTDRARSWKCFPKLPRGRDYVHANVQVRPVLRRLRHIREVQNSGLDWQSPVEGTQRYSRFRIFNYILYGWPPNWPFWIK